MSAGTVNGNLKALAAESLSDDAVGSGAVEHERVLDRMRPLGITEQMAHTAHVAFTFFADVADEQERHLGLDAGLLKSARDGKQSGDSGAVVGDAGAEETVAILADFNGRTRWEDCVNVSRDRQCVGLRVGSRTEAEYVADVVGMNISEAELDELLFEPVGA